MRDDPDEINLEPRSRYRIRGPARAKQWPAKVKVAPKQDYRAPGYYAHVEGSGVDELPTSIDSTPRRPSKKFKLCSDCPAMIQTAGGKKRCAPCSDAKARRTQLEGQKRRSQARKGTI